MGRGEAKRVRKPRKTVMGDAPGPIGSVVGAGEGKPFSGSVEGSRSNQGASGFSFSKTQSSQLSSLSSVGEAYETERIVLERLRGTAPDRKKEFQAWSKKFNERVTENNQRARQIEELQSKFASSLDRTSRSQVSAGLEALKRIRDESRTKAAKRLQDVYIPSDMNIK